MGGKYDEMIKLTAEVASSHYDESDIKQQFHVWYVEEMTNSSECSESFEIFLTTQILYISEKYLRLSHILLRIKYIYAYVCVKKSVSLMKKKAACMIKIFVIK